MRTKLQLMYRILKQIKKDTDSNVIVSVAMIDSQNEVLEYENETEAIDLASILNANSSYGLTYIVEKIK